MYALAIMYRSVLSHPVVYGTFFCVLIFLLYYPVLTGELIWDDIFVVKAYESESFTVALTTLFSSPFTLSDNYFRPIPQLLLLIERRLSSNSTLLLHSGNLVWLALNAALVASLIRKSIQQKIQLDEKSELCISFAGGIFYATHCALVEPAAWISARFDLVCSAVLLVIVHVSIKKSKQLCHYAIISVLFLLAALSKEYAAVLPIILVLVSRFFGFKLKDSLPTLTAVVIGGVIYLGLRWLALGHLLGQSVIEIASPEEYWYRIAASFYYLTKLMFFPFFDVQPLYGLRDTVSFQRALTESILTITALALSAVLTKRIHGGWLLLSIVGSVLPIVGVYPLEIRESIVACRFITFPLALFSIFLFSAAALINVKRREFVSALLGSYLFWVGMSVLCIKTVLPYWTNELSFWEWGVKTSPHNETARWNYVSQYRYYGTPENIKKLVTEAHEDFPRNELIAGLLTQIHFAEGGFNDVISIASPFFNESQLPTTDQMPMLENLILSLIAKCHSEAEIDRLSHLYVIGLQQNSADTPLTDFQHLYQEHCTPSRI